MVRVSQRFNKQVWHKRQPVYWSQVWDQVEVRLYFVFQKDEQKSFFLFLDFFFGMSNEYKVKKLIC